MRDLAKMKMPRFSLRTLLIAMAVFAVCLWQVPIAWREAIWRQPRVRLLRWEAQIDRDSQWNFIDSEYVWGRRYFISTHRVLVYPMPNGTVSYDWPRETTGPPAESPFGLGRGYFITPQCEWVESIHDAIAAWRQTTNDDWRRYESLHPQRSPTPGTAGQPRATAELPNARPAGG